MSTATVIGNTLLVAAAVPAITSVVVFSRVSWWRSPWGRHLMAYMSSVAVMLGLGCLKLIIGDSPTFAAVRVGAFSGVVIALWWRLWFIVLAYGEGSTVDGEAS